MNILSTTKLFLLLTTLGVVAITGLTAQPSPGGNTLISTSLDGLQYRQAGPFRGGRVTTVVGVPSEMFTFYMGATGGGLWKTTDAGLSWENISDGFFKTGSIGAIAVAPSDPNVIYVGTGAADVRGNVSPGKGMYKSTDGGETWQFSGLEKAGQIGQVVVHPDDPNLVYVAALGNVFGPNPERGVFRSIDGGLNWEKIHYLSERTGAIELVLNPGNPRILYAGMWTAERKPWTLIDGSDEGGVWKTMDGGDTWKQLEGGLPQGIVGRVGIAVSPVNPKRVWVIQEAKEETKGGIYRSDDGGDSWTRVNREHELRQRAWYYSRIYADPQDENTVYTVNVNFHRSIDGGKNFERIRTPHGDNHALWINPTHPQIMIEGNDGGACVTFNGGKTWTSQHNQPTAEFYRVTVDDQVPYRIYGAQQDNTTISVPSRSEGALSPTSDWYAVGGGESGHIAVTPGNPDLIYAGTYIGQITRLDRARGYGRDIVAYPQMHDGTAPRDIRYRFQWNAPIRISPHDPETVYHCSQYVHRTRDGGKTWDVISPDLTTNKDEYQDIPGGPVQHDHTGVELYTTLFAFEESPQQAGELWAGSDDGLLHLSRDSGKNWTNITPPQMPAEGTVNTIELSTHSPGRALVAVYKYRDNDFRPYIFLTDDYGKNWQLLTNGRNGIPADHFVRVVREDPERKGLLYAGTESGMYVSFNTGKNWQALQLNLPVVPITDMLIKDNDLVIATQGRSFWILDDLSPLREMTPDLIQQEAYLFPVNDAFRNQFRNQRGEDVPDPAPNGALIYYYLKEKPTEEAKVTLHILDADGKTRVVFSTSPDKEQSEKKLSPKAGLNRLEWDLKLEAPEVQEKAVFSLANTGGIKAPPGTYTVVLEMGDRTLKQPLTLRIDPRWTQSTEDLRAQYDLAMQVKGLLNETHAAIGTLRTVRSQVQDALKRAEKAKMDSTIQKEGKALVQKLTGLEEALIQTKSESGQDPINYPSMLDDQMAYLYSVVNAQDDRPTAGAYERYEDLKKAFEPYREEVKQLMATEVKAFNGLLVKTGMSVVGEE